ncbi:MAG: hypothetical protein M1840_006037 [Geoglossum simile]|nr:MAG: hypothetical protein M1840_006037 [Geoglossum simile]
MDDSALSKKGAAKLMLCVFENLETVNTNRPSATAAYECKTTSQERPYVARPSRTQQLLNPKLRPQLTSDVPNDLLRKKGVADEQLAKKAEERDRGRDRVGSGSPPPMSRKRSRSISSYSSVSTISTTLSQTPPARHSMRKDESFSLSRRSLPPATARRSSTRKRQRSLSTSSMSYSSESSYEQDRRSPPRGVDRNTRRKHGSNSPGERGRKRSRSRSMERKSNRYDRSRSAQLSRAARNRRSLTPDGVRRDSQGGMRLDRKMQDRNPLRDDRRPRLDHRDNDRYGSSGYRAIETRSSGDPKRDRVPLATRDRSLSPFSKRLALTQAMNMGR